MPKGKHSRVYLVGPLAIKILKPSFRPNARKEGRFLRQLQPTSLTPRLYIRLGRILVMERIRGTPVRNMTPTQICRTAPAFLKALHQLDLMGIQKEECHRPNRHFIHTSCGIKLIDFERAHQSERPSNVTQFVNFLEHYFPGIRKLGKAYKTSHNLKPILDWVHTKSEKTKKVTK